VGSLAKSGKRGIYTMRYYDRTGRQREESTRTADRDEAERLLKTREAAIANGAPITPQIGRFTFEDGVALIVADYELNDRGSIDGLRRRIRIGLDPWFGRRRLASVSTPDITAYAGARKKAGVANATINRELAALRRIFRLALRDGALLHMPAIQLLKEAKPRKGFFEIDAFRAVHAHLPAHHRPWSLFAYYSGWRVKSDILTREWAHVDRVHKLIRIDGPDTKNGIGRVFSYRAYPDLDAAIEACWAVHKATEAAGTLQPRVFVRMSGTWAGKPIKAARKAWITACRLAGQPGRHPHDFRRTAARNLTRHGVSQKVAKQLIGHETDEMFDRYAIVIEQDLHDAAEKQAAGLARDAARSADHVQAEAAEAARQVELQVELAKTASAAGKGQTAKLRRVK